MYCKEPMSDELLIIMNCFFFLLNSTALLLSRWQSSDELNWCVLPRAKFNGNCTISSKHTKWVDFLSLSLRLSAVLFPKLSRVARISFYFKWFSKVFWKNLFPNVSTYRGCGGGGNECFVLSFARFLMSSASDWAVRFGLLPPVSPDCTTLWSPKLSFCNFEWMMRLCLSQ